MNFRHAATFLPLLPLLGLVACGEPTTTPDDGTDTQSTDKSGYVKVLDDKGDASAEAVFLDFRFDGELYTTSTFNPKSTIEDQMLYTIGHLNGDNSVGDLNKLTLSNIQTESVDGLTRITYSAELLVAWGDKDDPITEYELIMPKRADFTGLEEFTEKYSHSCVDYGAHDVDAGSMWYYYRPNSSRCDLADEDVVRIPVTASISEVNTTGKYPEYHKVWEDDALQVVAVFGKYKDGATSGDAGINAYNRFLIEARRALEITGDVTTEPADLPLNPGVDVPDVTFRADLGDGKTVEIVALLVDNVRTAGVEFDRRYAELTPRADLIVYNGHAGLGSNIRAMASKGAWEPGQYSMIFMNGCDTYAYVDSALTDARAAINPDDPVGTKYVDILTNAMPSFFREMSNSTMALIRALLEADEPRTYEQIFADIDDDEVVIVSGEHDNVFVPGGAGTDPVDSWGGLVESGVVEAGQENRYATPTLPAGTYKFEIAGDGDADLYVRIGEEPTESLYDCRPFRNGSAESCVVELPAATTVHVMVRGWDPSSVYELIGE